MKELFGGEKEKMRREMTENMLTISPSLLFFLISILEKWKTASDVGMPKGGAVWEQKNQLGMLKGEEVEEEAPLSHLYLIYIFLFFPSYTRHIRYDCDT